MYSTSTLFNIFSHSVSIDIIISSLGSLYFLQHKIIFVFFPMIYLPYIQDTHLDRFQLTYYTLVYLHIDKIFVLYMPLVTSYQSNYILLLHVFNRNNTLAYENTACWANPMSFCINLAPSFYLMNTWETRFTRYWASNWNCSYHLHIVNVVILLQHICCLYIYYLIDQFYLQFLG